MTDGPVPGGCFKFSITLLGPLDDTRTPWPVEFRVGMLGWPFASCPWVPANAFDVERAVACRLQRNDFSAGPASLSLRRRVDGRLDLSFESGDTSLGVGARPIEVSGTGVYGVYIWHHYGRSVKYVMLTDGADTMMAQTPPRRA